MMKGKQAGWIVLLAAIFSIGGALLIRSINSPPLPDEEKKSFVESSTTNLSDPEKKNRPDEMIIEEGFSPSGELLIHVTAEGKNVADAKIAVIFPAARMRREAITDRNGIAQLSNLSIGEWGIGVRHLHYIPTGTETEIEEGKKTRVEIKLKPGALLHGRITDLQGNAIPGVKIYLCNTGEQITPLGKGLEAKTDSNGVYRIDGIPIRGVVILFTSNRYKPKQDEHQFTYAGEEIERNAQLAEGNQIKGRITDQGGLPLEDVSVTARNELAKATRTDAEGQFLIYGLGEEEVHLSAGKKGFGTVYRHDIQPNTMDLEIKLPIAGSLRGKILTTPLPKWFAVNLWRYDPYYKIEVRVKSKTVEGEKENFVLENITPGEYTLKIMAEGY
ncbi:MAG: carboxypeptidase-like regulatory domain-containing protein, partial [Planctomycetota bacterium]|nr:carboxypeptidase-like regulatory domain-containing protein [Planctomycetota bacterium]